MIRLQRERSEAAIEPGFRGKVPAERLFAMAQSVRALAAENKPLKLKFESKWSGTKDQLLKETNKKCAYCETPTAVVAFGDVEHYRPKSVYWWLAYVYDNYLAACAICNQKYKGNKFTFDGVQMAAPNVVAAMTDDELADLLKGAIPDPLDENSVTNFVALHHSELARIPNPYFDDPAEFFAWEVIDPLGEVELVPVKSNPRAANVVKAAEDIYGLNRIDLRQLRYQAYFPYKTFKDLINDPSIPEFKKVGARQYVAMALLPGSAYSGMLQYFERLGN